MATYDLTKKTRASTGQRIIHLGPVDNTMRVIKLEKRLDNQEEKLNKILNLLQNGNNLPNTSKQSS
jgi:hypothetical protein